MNKAKARSSLIISVIAGSFRLFVPFAPFLSFCSNVPVPPPLFIFISLHLDWVGARRHILRRRLANGTKPTRFSKTHP